MTISIVYDNAPPFIRLGLDWPNAMPFFHLPRASIIYIWLTWDISWDISYYTHEAAHQTIPLVSSPTKSPQHKSTPPHRNMSQSSHPTLTSSASSSNFRSILGAAMKNYKKKTKKDLLTHQLMAQLQTCESPSDILDVLNKQYNIQEFLQSQEGGESSKQWLNATVTVLCAFSGALGEGVGLVSLQNLSKIL
jgi:hypothetical protein